MNMKRLLLSILPLLSVPLASASHILYEGFDYSAATVEGQTGGNGFANAWGTDGGDALDTVSGLSYANHFDSAGSAASVSASANRSGVRSIADASSYTQAGQAQWFSLLANIPNAGGQAYATFFGNGNYNGAGIRVIQDGAGVGIAPNVGTTVAPSARLDITFNETQLIVGKIEWNTGTNATVSIWSPSDANILNEAALGEAVTHTANVGVGDRLWIRGNAASAGVFDEIRLGTELGDVVVVVIPEPSTYALGFGIVGLALVMLRRRFQKL